MPDLFNTPIAGINSLVTKTELASADGAGLVGAIQSGAGATARTVQAKLRETVSVRDFGAVGDGATDDTAAIQAAIDSLGAAGGTVTIPNGARCLVDGANLLVRRNVSLVGPHQFMGSPGNNTFAPYGSIGGALILNSARTITMQGGSALKGLLIHRKGMTFPASDASAFAGTAITADGDDITVDGVMALGFAVAYTSANCQRPTLVNFRFDCIDGVLINNCADIARLIDCHGWPFATIASGNISGYKRAGTAFKFTGLNDWSKATNCFSYGYFRGFHVVDGENVSFIGCGADNTPPYTPDAHSGAIGFLATGAANDTRFINCQGAAHLHTYYVETLAGKRTRIDQSDSWGVQTGGNSVLVVSGDASVVGGAQRQGKHGVAVNSAASRVFVDGVRFDDLTGQPVLGLTPTSNLTIGQNNDYGNLTGSAGNGADVSLPAVASASALALPMTGGVFRVTGTTGISTAANGASGRRVTLLFEGALTVTHGTGANAIRLSGATNFSVTAGGSLTLVHDGTRWNEVGRSA